MRVLVTFAVEAEFAPWREIRKFLPVKVVPKPSASPTEIWETSVGEVQVSVYLTGIGGCFPIEAMQFREAIWTTKPSVAISSGLAGALKSQYLPGQIVAAAKTRTVEDERLMEADSSLLALAADRGATVVQTMLSAGQVVGTRSEKQKLASLGEAVDMESAVVMKQFKELQITAITIRALSDGLQDDLPIDFARCVTSKGSVRVPQLVGEIVRHPKSIPALVRFGQQSRKAASNLATFLDKFISALPSLAMSEERREVAAR